jgi:hypothetical protein
VAKRVPVAYPAAKPASEETGSAKPAPAETEVANLPPEEAANPPLDQTGAAKLASEETARFNDAPFLEALEQSDLDCGWTEPAR